MRLGSLNISTRLVPGFTRPVCFFVLFSAWLRLSTSVVCEVVDSRAAHKTLKDAGRGHLESSARQAIRQVASRLASPMQLRPTGMVNGSPIHL